MDVKEVKDKKVWEDFLMKCEEKTFLDSWNWGEFNKMMGDRIWRIGISQSGKLLSVAQVIKVEAKRGTFLFVPHGPVFQSQVISNKQQVLKILLEELERIAKQESASFIRITPILERNEENIKLFEDLGFREAPIHVHPELTWELDISLPEEELLMKMRKTTRYLIRKGLKIKDIDILQTKDLNNLEEFDELYQTTADRHEFTPFSFDYLKNELLAFKPDDQISMFLGKYKNEIVSAAMILFWQGIGFYHQGASTMKYSKIPVSYLLQWEAIKEAKRRGCNFYNFWGIAPTEDKSHPWVGLTLFKKGFGGYKKEYVKTQDFVLSPFYWLTFVFERIRKIKRGL
jgi:lipid II:glycine glycyltransferase (peptidoglycan interpeptide bridge formation enzyme)